MEIWCETTTFDVIHSEEVQTCQNVLSRVSNHLHFFILSDFHAFCNTFPFFLTSHKDIHGILPLCLLPNAFYVTSR